MSFDPLSVLEQLTIAEKISLLAACDTWHTSSIPRLSIPSIRVSDGPNGVRGTKFFDATPSAALPNGTALAATFDERLLFEAGELMASEAYGKNAQVILGPTINIQRGPLGGRAFESFSEDPYVSGIVAASIIKGIQSKGIAATIKHYVGNDQENGRMYSNSIITERALREIYLEPFRLAIKLANPKCLMTSYNKVNGEHVSHSKKLLKVILRDEWKFDGTVVSDWYGTYSSGKAVENGLDIEFPGPSKWRTQELLEHLLNTMELSEDDINDRVLGALKLVKFVKEKNENFIERGDETTVNNNEKTAEQLRHLAAQSVVLLKNEDDILPLKTTDSIAVIGPNAKFKAYSGGGSASLRPYYVVSPYEGISQKLQYNPAYTIGAYGHKLLPGLVENLVTSDGHRGAELKFYTTAPENRGKMWNEEPFDHKVVDYSFMFLVGYENPRIDLANPIYYIDLEGYLIPEEDGQYEFGLVVFGTGQLFIDDELIIDNKTEQRCGDTFFSQGTVEEKGVQYLKRGQKYKIKVEYGSGPTSTFPTNFAAGGLTLGYIKLVDEQEEIMKAVELAKTHQKVVLCVGLNSEWESEGCDRNDYALPGKTSDLIEAVLKVNSNTVIVNQSGTPVHMPWLCKAKALVQAWYGGNELGNGIADVLFGDVNPGGKLPLSWPYEIQDNPSFLNFYTERARVLYGEDIYVGYRFYDKVKKKVAFPFGYGLSYTTFDFAKDSFSILVDENCGFISGEIEVVNTGSLEGSTVVQVYVSTVDSTIDRAVKELKTFKKVFLKCKESSKVTFQIAIKDSLSYYDEILKKWKYDACNYEIQAGFDANDIRASRPLKIAQEITWTGL